MSTLLSRVAPWTPWLLVAMAVVAAGTLLYIAWLLLGRTAPEEDESEDWNPVDEDPEDVAAYEGRTSKEGVPGRGLLNTMVSPVVVRLAVRKAYRALRQYAPEATRRRSDPWLLALGPTGARVGAVLESVNLPRGLPELAEGPLPWHVFDQGVVIQVPEELVLDGAGEADDRSWEALLSALVRHRPERPIDGVTLVLPARALVQRDPMALGGPYHALADTLFGRLRRAQSVLGVRFPVHVVVSGLEELPGFNSFASELPERMHGDAFGWSTPYSLDSAFQQEWVDEAFDEVYGELTRASTEILATRAQVDDPDGIFRFPDHFRDLQAPLRSLLAGVFRESAYHEGFFLRGIYFSGGSVDGEEASAGGRRPRSLFVTRLFQRKIFPERGLATPFRTSLLARNRNVRGLQIASILLVLLGVPGMWWAHGRLAENALVIEDVLERIDRSVLLLNEVSSDPRFSISGSGVDDSLFVAMSHMAEIDLRRFRSVFLPTSWFNGVDPLIDHTLAMGFQQVVVPVMRAGIVQWADTMSVYEWAAYHGAPPPGHLERAHDPESTRPLPEPGALDWYLVELDSLALNILRFNEVAVSGDLDPFASLVVWYFEQPLPPSFRRRDAFYRRALAEARERPISAADRPEFTDRALAVALGLVEGTYEDLSRRLSSLDGAMAAIASGRTVYSPDDLYAILTDIERVERFLDRSEAFWLDPTLPIGGEVDAVLNRIPEAGIISGPLFDVRFRREFERIRDERLAPIARLPAFSRVLATASPAAQGTGGPALAPMLDELAAGIHGLLAQGFMSPVRPDAPRGMPVFGSRPRWDPLYLDEVIQLFGEAKRFDSEEVGEFPSGFQSAVREITRNAIGARVQEAITAAMVWESGVAPSGRAELDRELGIRVNDFDQAARRLVRLMEMDEEAGGWGISSVIAEVLLLEVLDLLQLADQLLDEARPYQGVFGRWQGDRPAAWAAFDTSDEAGLEAYLSRQREVVQTVAERHVARILGFTRLPPVDRLIRFGGDALGPNAQARLLRWHGILRALDRFEAQEPGNSVSELEGFIRRDLLARGPGDCPVQAVSSAPSTTDWFVEVHEGLARAFRQRCSELARTQLEQEYEALRALFNEGLAGRAPFTAPGLVDSAPDADPELVRALVRSFDRLVAPLGEDAPGVVATLPGGSEVAAFLRRLGEVRPLLAAALGDPLNPESGGVGYRIDFRTNRSLERGADQIAEWALSVGARTSVLGASEDAMSGVWRQNDPVEFSLRWATGSPQRPLSDLQGGSVEGGRVRFAYGGPWGLLRLLVAQDPQRMGRIVVPGGAMPTPLEPGTLLFAIPTAPVEVQDRGGIPTGSEGLTLAFARLRMHDLSSGDPIQIPTFPTSAPSLEAAVRTGSPR